MDFEKSYTQFLFIHLYMDCNTEHSCDQMSPSGPWGGGWEWGHFWGQVL